MLNIFFYPVAAIVYTTLVYVSYRVLRTLFALLTAIGLYLIVPHFYRPGLHGYRARWTVCSGATDGIGKAYVRELARRGLRKFVIVGRSEKKLEATKAELEHDFNAQVETFLFDFFDGDYAALRAYIDKIDVGFVVNSVGVGREYLERYGDRPSADQQILKVNAYGAAEFLSCVLPPMERHGGGQIVVLSSSQGFRPIPLLAAYSAAKSLMSFLCECVDREYSAINVQCLTPALVATKMTYYEGGSLFVVTPENFCRQAVNTLGLSSKTTGCFNHEVQCLLRHLFPWTLLKHLMMPIYHRHQSRMIRLHGQPSSTTTTVAAALVEPSIETDGDISKTRSCIPRKVSFKGGSSERLDAAAEEARNRA